MERSLCVLMVLAGACSATADTPASGPRLFEEKIVAAERVRTGRVWTLASVPDVAVQPNQIDRVFHVTANLPDLPGSSEPRELHAYSYMLETDHHEPNGGQVRGVKGIVRANGGAANIRSAHFVVEGYNGHQGDVTGVLADAFHSDRRNGAYDPVGFSAAVIGQVGAGMQSAFEARSRGGVQRPAYGFRVQEGPNAVLPELAAFQAHGGGNGAMFRGLKSDTDGSVVFEVDRKARVLGAAFRSGSRSIGEGEVFEFAPVVASGRLWVEAHGVDQGFGTLRFRVGENPLAIPAGVNGESFAASRADLTGTTGKRGNLTVSAKANGNLQIENRTGGSRLVVWEIVGQ